MKAQRNGKVMQTTWIMKVLIMKGIKKNKLKNKLRIMNEIMKREKRKVSE